MDFKNISVLLEKYKNILPGDGVVKDALISVLSIFGIELKKENIKISRGLVYINCDFTTKSKIFVNKIEIMRSLREVLGKKTPVDII
ncbi:MAG: hypothetical protein Athens071416_228 [Parcubacteria group bacterium Athens0714_16]|nr:MAG: hypothetical protein Athens071416_228 [Parcubacteria group bacterium Athens0714_16]